MRAENNFLTLLLPALCWIHVLTLRTRFPIFKESGPFESKEGVKTKHIAALMLGKEDEVEQADWFVEQVPNKPPR